MSKIHDGGPAFGQVVALKCVRVDPNGAHEYEPEACAHGGVTVRDYFAAKAMQAWHANPTPDDRDIHSVAGWAYRQADAMLAARGAQ